MIMNTTVGQLVASLYGTYERRFRDSRRAAIATQMALANLTRARSTKAS